MGSDDQCDVWRRRISTRDAFCLQAFAKESLTEIGIVLLETNVQHLQASETWNTMDQSLPVCAAGPFLKNETLKLTVTLLKCLWQHSKVVSRITVNPKHEFFQA
jgi:hypothetical protein